MQYSEPLYFVIFLPVVVLAYHLFPQKKRWFILLIASYLFFMSLSGKWIIYLLLSTLSIYLIGLKLETLQLQRQEKIKDCERKERKLLKKVYAKKQLYYIWGGVFFNIGILAILKYSGFVISNMNGMGLHLPIYRFIVPIGISFYTLQALSYIIDVYHEKIKADHHLGRLALFMSFFPQLMEGPICRYEQTAQSLFLGEDIQWRNIQFGFQRIIYGLIKKIVIADRLNTLIKVVFKDYAHYDGGMIALAMVCYTCQLYMDFSGTLDIVIGSGEIFGIKLPENFKQPFFSRSISEFWTRWHITLGTWFKDYVYYPLSLSSRLRSITKFSRKYVGSYYGPLCSGTIALFCVWIFNGLWHGSAWSYIFFGMYHFVLITIGNLLHPLIHRFYEKTHIDKENPIMIVIRTLKTVILVCIGELFFRAHGLKAGLLMFYTMIHDFSIASFVNGTYLKQGVDAKDFIIVMITVMIVFVVSMLNERGISVREYIAQRHTAIRWSFWYIMIFYVLIFGAYGAGYVPVDPIYAGF